MDSAVGNIIYEYFLLVNYRNNVLGILLICNYFDLKPNNVKISQRTFVLMFKF